MTGAAGRGGAGLRVGLRYWVLSALAVPPPSLDRPVGVASTFVAYLQRRRLLRLSQRGWSEPDAQRTPF
jgi:hypothetical protein